MRDGAALTEGSTCIKTIGERIERPKRPGAEAKLAAKRQQKTKMRPILEAPEDGEEERLRHHDPEDLGGPNISWETLQLKLQKRR